MKCTNPIKCDGEMNPTTESHSGAKVLECAKCGFRAPLQKAAPVAKAPAPVVSTTENKGENN